MEQLDLQFDPNYKPQVLIVTKEEAETIKNFLFSCGYISYEYHAKLHEWIDGKLLPFLEVKK